jgi:hypothetical protein
MGPALPGPAVGCHWRTTQGNEQPEAIGGQASKEGGGMSANKQGNKTSQKQTRRRAHGSAWHWQQTDGWYFTPPGTKRRVALLDSSGRRIKGKSNKQAAELALARLKAKSDWKPASEKQNEQSEVLLVGKICSEYIEHCAERFRGNHVCAEHRDQARRILNDLANYCGALPVIEVQKAHLEHWLESHPTWRSPVTRRNNITTVLAAFEFARENRVSNQDRSFEPTGTTAGRVCCVGRLNPLRPMVGIKSPSISTWAPCPPNDNLAAVYRQRISDEALRKVMDFVRAWFTAKT